MAEALYLGLDIGGTRCAAIVGDDTGRLQEQIEWRSDAPRGPEPMIGDLIRHGRSLMDRHRVRSVGVAIGGPLDANAGIIYSPPNLPGWDGIRLKQQLAEALGQAVFVEHDAAACALAEYRWGAGQGAERLAYLTCGTGFGAGFIFDGHIYRGAAGRPSDMGHIRYRDDGPAAYGKTGSLEAFASGSALSRLAAWRFGARWGGDPPSGQQIAELADQGDADALEILWLNAQAVGDACALLVDVLHLDRIVLGSLARYLGEQWISQVRDRFDSEAHPDAHRFCTIVPAGLGERLGACSALVVAINLDA